MAKSNQTALVSNVSRIALGNVSRIALGIEQCRHGQEIVEGGLAYLAEGIFDVWRSPIRWSYGQGDNEVSGVSCIADMFSPLRKADGKEDSQFKPAMYRALAENYGVDGGFSDKDKMRFQRAFPIAAAKASGAPVEFATVNVVRKGESVDIRAIRVPAPVAFDLVKDDGSLTEAGSKVVAAVQASAQLNGEAEPSVTEALKRAENMPVNCIGGSHALLGKLPSATDISATLRPIAVDHGYMPPVKPRQSSGDKGAEFIAALDYVAKCLDSLGSDEPLIALANEGEKRLREVAELIAAYFVGVEAE
jgi:hypothetical protein